MSIQQKLADRLQGVRWADNYFYCLCPKHDDHRQSMLVWKDYFKCMSCGFQGPLERLEGYISLAPIRPFTPRKISVLPRWKKWEQRYGSIEGIAKAAHENVVVRHNDVYFKKRKVDKFIDAGYFGQLESWITIPIFDRDKVIVDIAVRSLNTSGVKYVLIPSDEPRPLYTPNWDRILQSEYLFVVYGLFTVWSLEVLNQPGCTGVTGKSLPAELLKDFHKPIYVIPDLDEERDAYHLCNNLGTRGQVLRIDWPDNCTDLDDIHRIYGSSALREILIQSLEVGNVTNNATNALRSISS